MIGKTLYSREILFVIGQLHVGGTEKHLATVAPALRRRGWRVAVCTLTGEGALRETLKAGGVEVIGPSVAPLLRRRDPFCRGVRIAVSACYLLWAILRRRPAIVHFFLPHAYLMGAPLAALARVPLRVMSRRSLNRYQQKYPIRARLERHLHRSMTAVLGNSRAIIDELRDLEGVPAGKLGLIRNGIDLAGWPVQEARAVHRAGLGLTRDALLLVCVANLIPYKGHEDLLDAAAHAHPHLPAGWRLLLAGRDDGIGNELRALASRLGIGDHVIFLGSRTDVPQILQACDIGLLCSHEEGLATAILEGMAAALPMIVTDVGGNAEAVLDGETGFVVPAHRPERLAEAIVRLAGDASLRGRLGNAGRRRIEEHFTFEGCVARYESLYRTLLGGGLPQDVPDVAAACVEPPDYSRQRRMLEG